MNNLTATTLAGDRNSGLPLEVSFFSNVAAKPRSGSLTWGRLVAGLTNLHGESPRKEDCTLLSLAKFGDAPNPRGKGGLRWDGNVTRVYGLVADYDDAEVDIDDAAGLLELLHGVEAFLYTSASHNRPKPKSQRIGPRWRVIAPFSRSLEPNQYTALMDRLNGAVGGILAPESWTLSQCYYAGRVRGTSYETRHVKGTCIDLLGEIEPKGKRASVRLTAAPSHARTEGTTLPADEIDGEIADIVDRRAIGDEKFQKLWAGEWKELGYASSSEARLALVTKLAFYAGRDRVVMDTAMRRTSVAGDKWDRLGEHEISKALELVSEGHCDAGKIEVRLRPNNQRALLDAITARLVRRHEKLQLVVYGGRIMHPYITRDRGFKGELVEVQQLNDAQPVFGSYLSEVIRWTEVKQLKDGPQVRAAQPPYRDLSDYCGRPELWPDDLRIERISETPIVRGQHLFAEPGLCHEARAWIHAPRIDLPEPTQDNARAALGRLREWLREFAFAREMDEAAAICALMSAAHRASVPTCPGFVITKPSIGAGASTLAKLVNIVLTGRKPAVINMIETREGEFEKQLDSAQLAGRASIVLDNVASGSTIYSDALASLLTEPQRRVRILGESKEVEVPCTQLVLVTGVNVGVRADLVRRFIHVRLDPGLERPYERTFKRPSLLEDAESKRAALLADLFMLSLAFTATGASDGGTPLAGYEEWRRLCVAPLVWLGMPDPVTSNRTLESDDESAAQLQEVLALWWRVYEHRAVSVRELLESDDAGFTDKTTERGRVRELLTQVGGNDARSVGKFLKSIRDRIVGGYRLTQGAPDRHAKVNTWVLEKHS